MIYLDRIKKLLRLARDSAATPAEAANALNRALELIARHKVDITALDLDEPTEAFVRDQIPVGARVSVVKFLIAGILQFHFNVRICVSRPHLVVVGRESDVAIARYVFEFLVGANSRAAKAWAERERKARRKTTGSKRENYNRGWIYGINANLNPPAAAIADHKAAIVLSTERTALESFFEDQFPDTKTLKRKPTRRNVTALTSGWLDGKRTSINTPLTGGEAPQLQLC